MKLFVFPLLAMVAVPSCSTIREKIQADFWLTDPIPAKLCTSDIRPYGIFRVVDCKGNESKPACAGGKSEYEEFISYCSPAIKNYLSMHQSDIAKWLKQSTRLRLAQ